MQVSGITTRQYEAINLIGSAESAHAGRIGVSVSQQDEVTLSPEAMEAFEKLAMYAGRASDYLPKVNTLNNSDSHQIGYAAWEVSFRDTYKAELDEYGSQFSHYYDETKAGFGILTANDHFEQVLQAEGNNPAFQQAFEDKLSNDPRMLELMDILGIQRPA